MTGGNGAEHSTRQTKVYSAKEMKSSLNATPTEIENKFIAFALFP